MSWRRRRNREEDWERELRSHLEAEAEEQQERGAAAEEARYVARRAFGNRGLVNEKVRDAWGWGAVERVWQDVQYALRLFRRAPGFTFIVLLTLALGIGADVAVFTVLNGILLRPLPYRDGVRLVAIWDREIHAKGTSKLFDMYSDYENWKKNARTFESVAAVSWSPQASPGKILRGHGPARSVFTLPVTADFFRLLGVPAMLGRTFDANDSGQGCKVVLTAKFWESEFGAQESVVGSGIRLDDQVCTVAGVMPRWFAFLPPQAPVTMWTMMPRPSHPEDFAVGVFARLRPDVTLKSAQGEALFLHRQLHKDDHWGAQTEPVIYDLHDEFTWLTGRNLRLSVLVLFGAVSLVLLICCVNVANLLLGRAVGREREMAVRAALGSGRGRLLRQLLTENLLLSLGACGAGVALAAAAVHSFEVVRPVEMPPGTRLELNAGVLGFTVGLAGVTALLFGLAPAWRASRVDLNEVLKAGGRTSSRGARQQRFGRGLIVAEVMLTVVLLAGAGLLIQTVERFASVPLGFEPEGLLTTSVMLPGERYEQPERRRLLYERLETGLLEVPGLEATAFSSARPVQGGGVMDVVQVEDHAAPRPEHPMDAIEQTVSPGYFRLLQIPLKEGRLFHHGDAGESEPVAIINDALAREYFGTENPIGRHIRPFEGGKPQGAWFRVVGVVGDEKRTTVYQEMAWADPPLLYRPLGQNPLPSATLIVRLRSVDRSKVAGAMERKIAEIDPDIPAGEIESVSGFAAQAMAYPRFRALVLGAFAGLALLLATVGLFGVLSHSVAQRAHEIGLRMALGAARASVVLMILREGLTLTAGGILLGVGVSWGLDRYLAALLYGVRPNPLLLTATSLVLLPAALVAMYLPVRRAAEVDPIEALRYE